MTINPPTYQLMWFSFYYTPKRLCFNSGTVSIETQPSSANSFIYLWTLATESPWQWPNRQRRSSRVAVMHIAERLSIFLLFVLGACHRESSVFIQPHDLNNKIPVTAISQHLSINKSSSLANSFRTCLSSATQSIWKFNFQSLGFFSLWKSWR